MNNNQNPKRRPNFNTQQPRKKQKLNPRPMRGRGQPYNRGQLFSRGRGQPFIRGRGRGIIRPQVTITNRGGFHPQRGRGQPLYNRGRGIRRIRGRGRANLNPNPNIPNRIPIPAQTLSQPIQTVTRTIINNANPNLKTNTNPKNSGSDLLNSLKQKALQSMNKKPSILPLPNAITNTNPNQPITNSSRLENLKQKALKSMTQTQTQSQIQRQQNEERKKLLMRRKKFSKSASPNAKPSQSQPTLNAKAQTFKPNKTANPTNLTINNAPSHSGVPKRKLKSYRKGPKSKDNLSFTTTLFDTNNRAVKTVISTNSGQSKTVTNNPNIPPPIVSRPSTNKPMKAMIKPKESGNNYKLALSAPEWCCEFCTFDNKKNVSLKCQMCAKNNTSKRPIPKTHTTVKPKPLPKVVSKPIPKPTANISKKPMVKPVAKAVQNKQKIFIAAMKPIKKSMIKPKKHIVNRPCRPNPNMPTQQRPIQRIAQNMSNFAKTDKITKIDTEAIWNEMDRAKQERLNMSNAPQKIISIPEPIVRSQMSHQTINPLIPPNKSGSTLSKVAPVIKSANIFKVEPKVALVSKIVNKSMKCVKPPQKPIVKVVKSVSVSKVVPKQKPVMKVVNKPMKPIVKVVKLPPLHDCWTLDVKEKINQSQLDMFVKETDAFIKRMDCELKEECVKAGMEYIDVSNADGNESVMFDIVEDFEWTQKICKECEILWSNNIDTSMNAFSNAVTQCDQW